jgi:hypothetical protein
VGQPDTFLAAVLQSRRAQLGVLDPRAGRAPGYDVEAEGVASGSKRVRAPRCCVWRVDSASIARR